jgi:SAM-dependent methyltransferase
MRCLDTTILPMSAFDRLARLWERNARTDALWAILASPGKEGRRWDQAEFFGTGERDLAELLRYLDARSARPHPGRALDFGCGVGRLTRALAARFEHVDGVDISPTMIERARGFTTDERIRYHVGPSPHLRLFPDDSFDLVLSILVLQHIPPPYNETYVAEFARVAAAGGILLFQVPHARRRQPPRRGPLRRLAGGVLRRGRVELEMYALPRQRVEGILTGCRCEILDVRSDGWAGDEWESYLYLARKAQA